LRLLCLIGEKNLLGQIIRLTMASHLGTSYRSIFKLSAPIMIGSALQQVIVLSDSVFLYHLSESDFASIGFVSVFYLIISAIGFNYSKGGQIMIARRDGEDKVEEVSATFHAMMYFEIGLALILFAFMYFGGYYFFSLFANSDTIFYKSLEYLEYRSFGVFFSFTGLAIISFYTGIARTTFIMVDALILMCVNLVLNYALIFGHFGLPEMGIAGAGLASTIAEFVALVVFVIYVLFDKKLKKYNLFKFPKINFDLIKTQQKLSAPVVAQAVVGFGSWFVFFGIIENLGERALAITNLGRMVYLALSIPTWGFASAANTLVSNLIGQDKRSQVLPIIWKTSKLCVVVTMILTIPVICFPEQILYPILGSEDMSLIIEAKPIFYMVAGILAMFAIGGVFFNGLAGTGATFFGLEIQIVGVIFYLTYIYVVVNFTNLGLEWAWASEIFYWILILGMTYWYLRSKRWYLLKV